MNRHIQSLQLSVIAGSVCAGLLASQLLAGTLSVDVILAEGDVVPGGQAVTLIQPPFTNGLGQVGFTGGLDDGDRYVWRHDGIVWRNSFDQDNTITGSTATMGIDDIGGWFYNPSINGNDGIITNNGILLQRFDPSPTEKGLFVTFTSRLQRLPDGTSFFVSGLREDQDSTATQQRILYRVAPDESFTKVFKSGDIVAGHEIAAPSGVGFGYDVSKNGEHHIHQLVRTGSSPNNFVYVDGSVAAFQGDPVGDGTTWNSFNAVSINNHGNWILSGNTNDGPTAERNYLAYNGQIAIRSTNEIDGVELANTAVVRAASINNLNQVVHAWGWGTGVNAQRYLFFGEADDLAASTLLFGRGDMLDTTGDGRPDAVVNDINGTTIAGPAIDFSDHPWVYVSVDLIFEGETSARRAIIRVPLGTECVGDLNNDGVVDGGDLLMLLADWGECGDCGDCPADLNDDCVVDGGDLLILLANWGPCP